MIEIANRGEQVIFDLNPPQYYGLKDESNDFLRIGYSGLNVGLLYTYDSWDEAETSRKKLTIAEKLTIDVIPQILLDQDQLILIERLERL